MSNNDLTANSKKFEAGYQNGKYGFIIDSTFYPLGGSTMKCVKYGTIDVSASLSTSVSVSTFGFTSAEDYMVILDGAGGYRDSTDSPMPAYIASKGTTSFSVQGTSGGTSSRKVSYQVISFIA